jgi:hypothetical protein
VVLPVGASVPAFCATANDVHPISAVIATVANNLFIMMFLLVSSLCESLNIEVRVPVRGSLCAFGVTLPAHASSDARRILFCAPM